MDNMDWLRTLTRDVVEISALTLIVVIGLAILGFIYRYLRDITQHKQAIRRNYPVLGRFRYLFEHLSGFFRQYFFAQDREELPFNRAQIINALGQSEPMDVVFPRASTRPEYLVSNEQSGT